MFERRRGFSITLGVVLLAATLPASVRAVRAEGALGAARRAFAFPPTLANGLTGDLVLPPGSATALRCVSAHVAIGELPVPVPPSTVGTRGRQRDLRFMRPSHAGAHARLLLLGVTGADGMPVDNTGNRLVIGAQITPGEAGTPPFVVPFDIHGGSAFVDVPLPIVTQADGPVTVQLTGVSVVDPQGQSFGVLGFALGAAPPAPTPGGTPIIDGQCFVGPACSGPSFPASQTRCCRLGQADRRPASMSVLGPSWCPAGQFDPQTGTCTAGACAPCAAPVPSATPVASCEDRDACGGPCLAVCSDGTREPGQCVVNVGFGRSGDCQCAAPCGGKPTPTPGPSCEDRAMCGGPCAVTCADGTSRTGRCVMSMGSGIMGGCQCAASCGGPPMPTPGESCGAGGTCGGPCTARCSNGSVISGKCALGTGVDDANECRCVGWCAPTPTPTDADSSCGDRAVCGGDCAVTCADGAIRRGRCARTERNEGTGDCACTVACDHDSGTPTPEPTPPILPHGRLCCQCSELIGACFEVPFVEIIPSCPEGCTALVNGHCDAAAGGCVAATACARDADCDDGNPCTIDRCASGLCENDCVCLGPNAACGPGPLPVMPR